MIKKATTAIAQLHDALRATGARCVSVVDGPNKTGPTASELEFWSIGSNEHSRMIIVQRWTRAHDTFSYYLEGQSLRTEDCIADIMKVPS